jgi:hypothetical protein
MRLPQPGTATTVSVKIDLRASQAVVPEPLGGLFLEVAASGPHPPPTTGAGTPDLSHFIQRRVMVSAPALDARIRA